MSVALVFPGQGSQYPGMGKELCRQYKIAAATFNQASEISGMDLKKLCGEGSPEELAKTVNTQQIVFTMGVAAYRVFMQEVGVIPEAFAGHSLGEITALTCANVIDFGSAVTIVKKRAAYMQEAAAMADGAMAVLGNIDSQIIDAECQKRSNKIEQVGISNYNAPYQTVISGHKSLVVAVVEALKNRGAVAKYLNVNGAFHSPLMYSAAYKLQEELKKHQFKSMSQKVMSNLLARPYQNEQEIVGCLSLQLVRPVQWAKTVAFLDQAGIDKIVELGPGQVLKNITKANWRHIKSYAFDWEEDVKRLKTEVFAEEKPYLNNIITMCLADAVSTKSYIQAEKRQFEKMIAAYNEVLGLYKKLKKDRRLPERKEINKALEMTHYILEAKGLPWEEQKYRLAKIITQSGCQHLFNTVP
jgi:[acyl-carrier-protein] S-malonyltransferase